MYVCMYVCTMYIVSSRVLTSSPEKLTPLTENPFPDCNILNPPEFHHLKLVEIPITTVLFLTKTWLTYSLTLTH